MRPNSPAQARCRNDQRPLPGDADMFLAGLWRLARHDADEDAGTLLIACLAPGIDRIARDYGRILGRDEAQAIAVAAIWDRVARFDPFPQNIAHRLLWLARRQVNRAAARRRAETNRSTPRVDEDVPTPAGLSPLVLLRQAVTARVVTPEGASLTWATRCADLPLRDAGRLIGLGYEATKKRRQRTEAALAAWLTSNTRRTN